MKQKIAITRTVLKIISLESMTKDKKQAILKIFKGNRPLTSYEISKIVGCNNKDCEKYIKELRKNTGLYTDETQELVRMYSDLHLEPAINIEEVGIYYLFTKIAEKKLITEKFKIINSEDFSKTELDWLEQNYKFRCKSRFI